MNTYKLIIIISLLTCLALAASTIGPTNCLPGTLHEHAAPKSSIFIQCKSASVYLSPMASDEKGNESVTLAKGTLTH